MKICNCTAKLAFLALIAAGLLAVPPETQAQEPENFAWITNTNGMTWKKEITPEGYFFFSDGEPTKIRRAVAQIIVPKHAIINRINVSGCINLTNIVLQIDSPREYNSLGVLYDSGLLSISALRTSLRNITCSKEIINRISLSRKNQGGGWWAIQWTELLPGDKFGPPKIEIKTRTTANGVEVEVIWRESTLQIADAVNGKWRDYIGNSPLRIPLWIGAKGKQFYRIKRIESPTTEEPPTPQTLGGNR